MTTGSSDPTRSSAAGSALDDHLPLSTSDFHVLLVLAERDLYGYALMQAVERESGGVVTPDLGALYRALARLERGGLVEEAASPEDAAPSPGRQRRYYGITGLGRRVLAAEASRLRSAVELATLRLAPGLTP
ncbi:MAG: PadR family transcriptional regulator [Acidobacteria bacterium]|nr:MAG: PadR family transcriptional regulator [Acidobacteriota bacterium]